MMEQGGTLGGASVWLPTLQPKRQEALRLIDERGMPVPTLVIWGNDDASTPLDRGLDLYTRIAARTPQAEFHVVNQAHHAIAQDQPEALTRAIASFCLG